jgi:hypothetical protein
VQVFTPYLSTDIDSTLPFDESMKNSPPLVSNQILEIKECTHVKHWLLKTLTYLLEKQKKKRKKDTKKEKRRTLTIFFT